MNWPRVPTLTSSRCPTSLETELVMLRARLATFYSIIDLLKKPRTPRKLRLFSTDFTLLSLRNATMSIDLTLSPRLLLMESRRLDLLSKSSKRNSVELVSFMFLLRSTTNWRKRNGDMINSPNSTTV